MFHITVRSAAVLGASLFALSTAQAVVLDFEGFGAGTIINSQFDGVTISATTNSPGSANAAVIFDTNNPTGGDSDLGAPFSAMRNGDAVDAPLSPGNVLILQEDGSNCGAICDDPDDDANGGQFIFSWTSPIILNSVNFFDIEADEAGAPITIQVMTPNGVLPAFVVPGTGGDNTWANLDFGDIVDVIGLTISLSGSGAIDDLSFNIPLPGVAWLFFPGLAVLGVRMRRRQPA